MAHFLTLVFVDPEQSLMSAHDAAVEMIWSHCTVDTIDNVGDDDETAYLDYKLDEFQLGGMFDGCLWDEEERKKLKDIGRKDSLGFLGDARPENNIRPVSQVRETALPASCITPDEQWHDLYALFDGERREKWSALRQKYPHHLLVSVDCQR